MAELTLEAAQQLVESIDDKGRARDEKGRFVAQEQVKIAKELIQQNKKITESNKSGFQSVVDATKEANKDFQEIKTLQSALKDEQSSATKAQKELVKLQQQGESERKSDHDQQIEKQEKIIEESQKTSSNIKSQIDATKDQLSPLQKENLALQERKESLEEMAEGLRSMGLIAEEDKAFRKEQQAIQLAEIELRKQGDIPLSKRLELEKEKASAQAKSDSILQKGFGNLKLGIANLAGKFGAGAMTVGTALLTLFGLGLLIKFLKSDTWESIRDFLKSPSWESFKEIFMPEGTFSGIALAIVGAIGVAIAGLAALTFKMLGGGLLVDAFTGLFKLLGKGVRGVARFLKIPGFKAGQKFGKGVAGGVGKTSKAVSKGVPKGDTRPMREIIKDRQLGKTAKKPGFFSRTFGAAKKLGGAALEKGAKVARAVGTKAVDLGKTGLEKGAKVGKQVASSATKIGKDAVSGAKAVLPKIAGASKAGLKMAAKGAKFIPGVGLAITGAVAAVEGVAAGVEEFKESGDVGRAVAEGLGGVVSSISFGLLDKDQIADLMVDPAAPKDKMTSDQLAQAMVGEPSVGPMQDAAKQNRLSQMKSLEAKMAKGNGGGANVNVVNQDSSVRTNSTSHTHTSTSIVDRDLDFLASPVI